MADITPLIPAGRQLIQGYGGGGFRISNRDIAGSVLVFPDQTLPWPVTAPDGITLQSFANILSAEPNVEILLIGCGREASMLAPDLRQALGDKGVSAECMDTGAACRTFNVLMAEDRAVAAALIAVP